MDEATELWALLNDSSLSSSPSSLSPSWFFEMLRNQTALEMLSNYTNDFDFNGTSLAYPKSIILSSIASETSTSTSISTTKTTTITSTGKNQRKNEFYSDLFTIAVYSLIILVSLCGNSLVLRMILVRKKMQTTTNILIAWLAVSDLLTTTLNIPFNVARFLSMNYPFPSFFCKLVPFIQVMCVYVSTLTMGVIAFHRYLTVTSSTRSISITKSSSTKMVRPLLLHGSICFCAIMTSVWFFAGLLATPHSMFNQIALVPYQNKTYVRCRAEYPKMDFNFRFVLSLEAFLTQYMIPLGLICFLYIRIGSVVAKQGRVAQKATSHRRMKQESARRRRLTMIRYEMIGPYGL
ncbi:Neuropeptide Y receptor type 2 [Sarcoptes scabiei]|uniref:Neuropeptide Y receptor type 2 n=1 Tax=Sarcoptes scabiei TaxID=52283 RepID=A0A834VHW4_SARSC|nr:Neuropeptide Y receptor type 2 [Sarcoptes scabiei]